MARRHHPCDVPGCNRERDKRQRLCWRCYRAVPVPIRDRILRGWKFDRNAWREGKRQAGAHMAPQLAGDAAGPAIQPSHAYALANRITGDRDLDWPDAAE